jgi:putative nucleotidyltransferase with HDIG domain
MSFPTLKPRTPEGYDAAGLLASDGFVRRLSLTRTTLYTTVISASAVLFVIALVEAGWGIEASPYALLLLAGLAAVAERQPVRVNEHLEMTVAVIPMLFATIVFGPVTGIAVCALGLLAELRRPFARWLIWTSHRVIAAGLVGLAVLVSADGVAFRAIAVSVIVACCLEAFLDVMFGATTAWVRQLPDGRDVVTAAASAIVAALPVYAPALILIITAYEAGFTWAFVLFLIPAVAAHSFYRLYRRERAAREAMDEANASLQDASISFGSALISALEARDEYTAGHSAAVAVYSGAVARELGLTPDEEELARLAGLLHDIGKVGLPPGLLEKTGPLSPDERRLMEEHSVIGERILSNVTAYQEIARFVRHHHERVDGRGYPDGLGGLEIPLISRIVSVVDAYSAMTSDRPYRKALSDRQAQVRLRNAVGAQFDGHVVDALDAVLGAPGLPDVLPHGALSERYAAKSPALSVAV